MLNNRLHIIEYLFILGSFVAIILASNQLIYAVALLFICLFLNLINRLRYEQYIKRRLATAITQLHKQVIEESQSLQEQQIQVVFNSLQAQLPNYLSQLEVTAQEPSNYNLVKLKNQITSLEASLKNVVQDINGASLPTRIECLERVIAQINTENAQTNRQQSENLYNYIQSIEMRLQAIEKAEVQLPICREHNELYLSPDISSSVVPQEQNNSALLLSWSYLKTLAGHSDWISALAITPDGKNIVSGSFDKTIKLWNLSTGQLIRTLSPHIKGVICIAISPDGKTLASAGWDETIKLWSLNTGELIYTLEGHTGSIQSLIITADSQTLISGSFDQTIKLWCLERGEFLGNLAEKAGHISALALSTDGQTLASAGGDGMITLRQLDTARIGTKPTFTLALSGNLSSVASLFISPDDQILVAGCTDGNVKLWQLATGELVNILHGHTAPVTSVVFSLNSPTLISGSADGTIRTWDMKTGKQLSILPHNSAVSVMSVAISPDGQLIAGGTADNMIKIWQCD